MNRRIQNMIVVVGIVLVLALTFFFGGSSDQAPQTADSRAVPTAQTATNKSEQKISIANDAADAETKAQPQAGNQSVYTNSAKAAGKAAANGTEKGAAKNTGTAAPAASTKKSKAVQSTQQKTDTCIISISCATVLDNLDSLDQEKQRILPKSGVILAKTTVTLEAGDSVFSVLQRVTKEQKMPMEFVQTPAYDSTYIEGIANLYEFDCGELSGWQYSVNGVFPPYGSSRCTVQNGDEIKWLYTCDLGKDIGGANVA